MTDFGEMFPDPEEFADRMARYLAGDKAAVKEEVAAHPSAEWDEDEFCEWLDEG
jgi:hypothetical protein